MKARPLWRKCAHLSPPSSSFSALRDELSPPSELDLDPTFLRFNLRLWNKLMVLLDRPLKSSEKDVECDTVFALVVVETTAAPSRMAGNTATVVEGRPVPGGGG